MWRENHPGVEVEATRILTPNLLTFQLVTGDERYYCMGVYIPPNDIMGVEDLRSAWDACPDGCIPIVLGDLNINFQDPRDEREEQIVDLLDEINLIDTSRRFAPRRLKQQKTGRVGLGGKNGMGGRIIPSLITSWHGRGTCDDFGRLASPEESAE